MIFLILMALGLMLIIEGLVYVLAPSFIENLLKTISDMPLAQRRQMGLLVVALGAVICALAHFLGSATN